MCSVYHVHQKGMLIDNSNPVLTCGNCGNYVCDACRLSLMRLSTSPASDEEAAVWGMCPGAGAQTLSNWHVYRPVKNQKLTKLIVYLCGSASLQCHACQTAHNTDSSVRRRANYPHSVTLNQLLWHQMVECRHMCHFCPARCGYFASRESVYTHVRNGDCERVALTHVPARSSMWGELRVLPSMASDQVRLPIAYLGSGQCKDMLAALPLMAIEQLPAYGSLFVHASCAVPASKALRVMVRVEVWPHHPTYYKPGVHGQYLSTHPTGGYEKEGAFMAHEVNVDGIGRRVYAMAAGVTNLEEEKASMHPNLISPGYWQDTMLGRHRPVRSYITNVVINGGAQVKLVKCLCQSWLNMAHEKYALASIMHVLVAKIVMWHLCYCILYVNGTVCNCKLFTCNSSNCTFSNDRHYCSIYGVQEHY